MEEKLLGQIHGKYNSLWYQVYYTYEQNIETNSTTFTFNGYFTCGGTQSLGSNVWDSYFKIDGTNLLKSNSYRYYPGKTLLGSVTKVIKHNDDGVFPGITINIAAYSYHFVAQDLDCNITSSDIATIPRAPTIVNINNFKDTENPVIEYYDKSATDITISISRNIVLTRTIPADKQTGKYTFELSATERTKLLRDAYDETNPKLTVTVENGLGLSDEKTVTMNIVDAKPSCTISFEEINGTMQDINLKNKFINGFSSISVINTGFAKKYSNIILNKIKYGQQEKTSKDTVTFRTIFDLKEGENPVIIGSIQDSRQNYAQTKIDIPIINYFRPAITMNTTSEITDKNPSDNIPASVTLTNNIEISYFNENITGEFSDGTKKIGELKTVKYKLDAENEKGEPVTFIDWTDITSRGNNAQGYWSCNLKIDSYTDTSGNTQKLPYNYTYKIQVKTIDNLCSAFGENEIMSNVNTIETGPVFDWSKKDFNFNVPISCPGFKIKPSTINMQTPDASLYYPVYIRINPDVVDSSQPMFFFISKQLGKTWSSQWEDNSGNGASLQFGIMACALGDKGQSNFIKTLFKQEDYTKLIANVQLANNGACGIVVWLRGGQNNEIINYTLATNIEIESITTCTDANGTNISNEAGKQCIVKPTKYVYDFVSMSSYPDYNNLGVIDKSINGLGKILIEEINFPQDYLKGCDSISNYRGVYKRWSNGEAQASITCYIEIPTLTQIGNTGLYSNEITFVPKFPYFYNNGAKTQVFVSIGTINDYETFASCNFAGGGDFKIKICSTSSFGSFLIQILVKGYWIPVK